MRVILPTNAFLKQKKKLFKRGKDFSKMNAIVTLIQKDKPLPLSAYPHKLSGEWKGFWECHIEPDWLLIYDVTDDAVLLVGTGTHEDLLE